MPRIGRSQPFPPKVAQYAVHIWEPSEGDVKKMSTVAWASVSKVSGVAEANISKVSTIEAN